MSETLDLRSYTALTDRVMTALGGELKDLRQEISRRLDQIASDGKDVGERLSRIEGMQVGNAQELKDLKETVKAVTNEVRTGGEKVQKLENRLVRLETLIVPAATFLSAVATSLAGHFLR